MSNLARVTGDVINVDTRSGTTAEGRSWALKIARVLVGNKGVIEVTGNDDSFTVARGDLVDWLVEVSSGGRYGLNVRFAGYWEDSLVGSE